MYDLLEVAAVDASNQKYIAKAREREARRR